MSDDIQRTLGEHGAKLESLGAIVTQMDGKLDALILAEAERKGAKKTIYGIAAAAGAVASFIAHATVEAFKK